MDSFFLNKSKIIFPYSNEFEKRKLEIWSNLEKGIYLENNGILLRWNWFYNFPNEIVKRFDNRTYYEEWSFGLQNILNGFELHIGTEKQFNFQKFNYVKSIVIPEVKNKLINHLIDNLGQADIILYDYSDDNLTNYECQYEWIFGNSTIKIKAQEFHGGYGYYVFIGNKKSLDKR